MIPEGLLKLLHTGEWSAKLDGFNFNGNGHIWKNKDTDMKILLSDYYKLNGSKAEKPLYFFFEEYVKDKSGWIVKKETKRLL